MKSLMFRREGDHIQLIAPTRRALGVSVISYVYSKGHLTMKLPSTVSLLAVLEFVHNYNHFSCSYDETGMWITIYVITEDTL